ncbi:MAG: hypothetical protein IT193_02985 [Propionibacteriaceae bacterium]|nr:hypothetical protein [Propionibacteriaceae bacterium]
MIEWRLTDRANRVGFFACLAAATVLVSPVLFGEESLLLMVSVLVLVAQAWRLALARELTVRLDDAGIAKQLGSRHWRLAWSEVGSARLIGFLGSMQLVVTTNDQAGWGISDRLAGRLPRNSRAIQVPDDQLPAVEQLLSDHGLRAA